MSRSLTTVIERHKAKELGTRSTHGSSEFGFDPKPPINPYYVSQSAVDTDRIFESDGVGQRLQAPVSLAGGGWVDVLSVPLSGSLWVLMATGQVTGPTGSWRIWDGFVELASAQGPAGSTIGLNALVLPRGGATYVLQAQSSGGGTAVAQITSLIAIRAFS